MTYSVWVLMALCSSVFFSSSSLAFNFYVGGKDGYWISNPPETYNHWAERNRFQVNDTLTFKIKQGSDSVLVVNKDDYYSCNTKNPIMNMQSLISIFKFDHSGPFFFIASNQQNCLKSQKLIVVVMAVRPITPNSTSPSPSPSPSATSPKSSSPSPYSSLSPSPSANSPKSSSPSSSMSPSPAANSPKSSSPSPYFSLSPSPGANSPKSSSPSPSPSSSMSPSPSSNSPQGTSTPAPTPDSGETADVNSPTPDANSKSGSPAVTASTSMMLMAIALVIISVVHGV